MTRAHQILWTTFVEAERTPLTHVKSARLRALHLTRGQAGRGSRQEVRPVCFMDASVMHKSEIVEFHQREAARYRRLLANATTPALKARLAEEAEEHERQAKELDEELADA